MNFVKRAPVAISAIVILILALIGWFIYSNVNKGATEKKKFEGVAVEVERARLGSLTKTVTAVGTLVGNQSVKIRPEVHGLISKIHVTGGEEVKEGDPLFEIDSRTFQAELKEAQARLALAQAEYNRTEKLAASNFASGKNRDKVGSELKIAEANVDNAKTKLERTVIYAPFTGIIGIHNLSIGSPINEQTELATLVDVDPIKIDFKLPADYLKNISVGQTVKVTVDGFGNKIYKAIIESIDSTVEENGHSIAIRAVMNNKNGVFKPGIFARADVIVGSKDDAIIVPQSAIEISGDEEFLYKVVEGIAFRVPVATDIQEGENVDVIRGVNAGDLIITVGQSKIRDGVPVKYMLDGELHTHDPVAFKKLLEENKDQEEGHANAEESKTDEATADANKSSDEKASNDAASADSKEAAETKNDASSAENVAPDDSSASEADQSSVNNASEEAPKGDSENKS
ncbi:MAG: efflux RND transporter periplasmic adaptor subunit [Candidatus Nucleicultricaceae bacterium]